jgi:hypothetical protein
MSNDSTSSARSIASKIKGKLTRKGSDFTRKLRLGPSFEKKAPRSGGAVEGLPAPEAPASPPFTSPVSAPTIFDLEVGSAGAVEQPCPQPRRPSPDVLLFKGRSYSSPYPLTTSVLDIVPPSTADITLPITSLVPSYFEERLPHELQVRVLMTLVRAHEEEHEYTSNSSSWTALKASSTRNRWVGTDKAMRELIKFGRVSSIRSW